MKIFRIVLETNEVDFVVCLNEQAVSARCASADDTLAKVLTGNNHRVKLCTIVRAQLCNPHPSQ